MKKIAIVFSLFFSICSYAQLPETSIYLLDVLRKQDGFHFSTPRCIAGPGGYNNQPWFTPDEKYMLYIRSVDSINTEIYRYDVTKKKSRRLTHTPEAEYSARYSPNEDRITCVRVEKDRIAQRMGVYHLNGRKPGVILPGLQKLGYYEWLNGNEFLSFELPEPFSLVKHNLANNRSDTLCQAIGRTFAYVRTKNRILYIDKTDTTHWVMRTIAPENLRMARKGYKVENPFFTEIFPGEEDFCVFRDGSLLMAHEGILYIKRNPFRHPEEKWKELLDLKPYGIAKCYRLAISPDNRQLAIVVYTGTKP